MTAETLKTLLSSPASLFVLMLLASIVNGLKQLAVVKQTGAPMNLWQYLAYWPETLAMILANIIGFATLVLTDQLNYASALSVGYSANSVIDLLPGKRSVALKATPDNPAKITPTEVRAAVANDPEVKL